MGGGNPQEYQDYLLQRTYGKEIQQSRLDLAAGKELSKKDPWTEFVLRTEDPAAKKARMLRAEALARQKKEESDTYSQSLAAQARAVQRAKMTGGRDSTFRTSPGSTAGASTPDMYLNKKLGGA